MLNSEQLQNLRRHLRILEREVERNMKQETTCCGVSLAQCHVMLELDFLKETTVKILTERLELDKSTLSRTIDGLEKEGSIYKVENPEDKRSLLIKLTESGQKKADMINQLCNQFYETLFSKIPKDKHENIMESIVLLVGAMQEMKTDFPNCCVTGE